MADDKKKREEQWASANPKLAEAKKKRDAERGTSNTSNPLMADFKPRMKAREDDLANAKKDAETAKVQGNKSTPPSTPAPKSTGGRVPADVKNSRSATDWGGAGGGNKNYNTPDEKSKYVAPNGQPYKGPGYGSGSQVQYKKSEPKPAEKKPEARPQRRMSAGDQRYMNEWDRKRKGESRVIG